MKILAIDTSCDETSVAILDGRSVLTSIRSSQVELHKKWGGVVPDISRRAHIEALPSAFNEALKRARLKVEDIDYFAATQGPGLAIDLEIGIEFTKELAIKHNKPFIPVNHMEGHLLSSLALNSKGLPPSVNSAGVNLDGLMPALGLLVSGKHTELIYLNAIGDYKKLGETIDDAAGEAYDKVGRMLNFGYPGGPIITEFAKRGKLGRFQLPIPMKDSDNLNFSYSGLKTACLYKLKTIREEGLYGPEKGWSADFCKTFVDAVVKSIILKLEKAIKQYPECKSLLVGGGVFLSPDLSRAVGLAARRAKLRYLLPLRQYRSDNAAMIGLAAYFCIQNDRNILNDPESINSVERIPRLGL